MSPRPNILERAYDLARSGKIADAKQLITELKREGYEMVESHISGRSTLRRELNEICGTAWLAAGNVLPITRRRH